MYYWDTIYHCIIMHVIVLNEPLIEYYRVETKEYSVTLER